MRPPRVSLYALLVATHAADVAITGVGLSAGLVETNPASAALLALGLPVWVAVKALVLAAVGVAAELLPAWVVDPPVMLMTALTGLAALTNAALVLGVVA
jgi:hypothetical protein